MRQTKKVQTDTPSEEQAQAPAGKPRDPRRQGTYPLLSPLAAQFCLDLIGRVQLGVLDENGIQYMAKAQAVANELRQFLPKADQQAPA